MPEVRRVRLRIRERNSRFQALLSSDLHSKSTVIDINVSFADLKDWNKELTEILAKLTRKIISKFGNQPIIPQDSLDFVREEFQWLAQRSYTALNYIFHEDAQDLLREVIGAASHVILDIDSELFVIPWELLYDNYEPGHLDYNNFWGFKYIIYRNIPPHRGRPGPSSNIEIDFIVGVGLLADKNLIHVAKVELPFLQDLQEKQNIKLVLPLKRFKKQKREIFIRDELKRFLGQEVHILHFACHTREPIKQLNEPHDEYCLLLSKDFSLWPSDFLLSKLNLTNNPLVILNACGTSPRDPQRTWNMVRVLLRYGARGVITTECMVPDALAAAFTQQFYPQFLKGQELGFALFEARQSLLRAPYNNPLGLLYAMYALPYTKFIIN